MKLFLRNQCGSRPIDAVELVLSDVVVNLELRMQQSTATIAFQHYFGSELWHLSKC